jgi:hypothetical protein
MPGFVEFGQNLAGENRHEQAIRNTYIGMAHLAGSGPEGRTCRECIHYGSMGKWGDRQGPGYYSESDPLKANQLKQGRCFYAIPHKSPRRFPHDARACRFFEASETPWPLEKPVQEVK